MRRSPWAFVLGVMIAVGCGKPGDPPPGPDVPASDKAAANELRLLGMGYEIFSENDHHPPRTLDDLKSVVSSDTPVAFERFHIIFGVDLKAVGDPRTVLAYEADAPTKGGLVLFPGGKVERVSAEDFARLPKGVPAKLTAERPADVTFTPEAYLAEYQKIGNGMGQKYRGKVVELKGVVGGLRPRSGPPELLVITPGKEGQDVRCFLPPGEEFWAKVGKGQEVTVKGLVREPQGSPMLTDCGITALGAPTAVTTTAEELAKNLAAAGGSSKYRGKSLVLTGEVVSVDPRGAHRDVMLKGTADRPIECVVYTGYAPAEQDKLLTPGAKLKLYAEYAGENRLSEGILLSK